MSTKEQLIQDIQNLLNSYDTVSATEINPNLLEFMDQATLKQIVGSLLDQKETHVSNNTEWLEKFKRDIN